MPKAPLKKRAPSIPVEVVPDELAPKRPQVDPWEKARSYVGAASLFQKASLAAQVMVGFELVALHKQWDVKRGGDRRSKPHDAGLIRQTWEDALKKHLGLSADTAARWMDMAKAAKPRLAKSDLQLADILGKNPAGLTSAEQELLTKAVHKITDGHTQLDFLASLGATKAAIGGSAKGGKLGKGVKPAPMTPAEQLEAERVSAIRWHQEQAMHWKQRWLAAREFRHLPDEATQDGELTLDQFIALLKDTLEAAQDEVKARAKTPTTALAATR